MSNSSGLAVLYEPDGYSFLNKVMGRQSAGIGFVRAVAGRKLPRVWCYTSSRDSARAFAQALADAGSPRTGVAFVPYEQPGMLADAGLLYRPDPMLASEAWRRLSHAEPRAYSLCGVTHTLSSHSAMESLAGLAAAPLEEWDALVCTSRVARDSARVLIEAQAAYLRERLGATRLTLPQMPVIPLGVHCDDFSPGLPPAKDAARAALGLPSDRTVILFVGRLSFHGKAHPLPMYLGLEEASRRAPVTLVQAGLFANGAIREAFEADARALCPSVPCRVVDGRDEAAMRNAWTAADVFTSLSDNVQETFGLTPVEAMAAGLPVVVSDWDGYKDTVRDGVDGFRIPTLTPAAGSGEVFADRFDLGLDTYDYYCGRVSQLTAVSVEAAGEAYARLALDPELRARMGAAGRAHARAEFDWSVVFRRYEDLWADLAERRRATPNLHPPLSRRRRPDRPDPFTVFSTFPTAQIGPATRVRRCAGVDAAVAEVRRKLRTVSFAESHLPSPDLVASVLAALESVGGGWETVQSLANRHPATTTAALHWVVVWLAKVGAVDFRH